jgi:GT2 family glycosyltransferase/exo-beta-1,3-glucanase (GH17 family)
MQELSLQPLERNASLPDTLLPLPITVDLSEPIAPSIRKNQPAARISVRGKFLFQGQQRLDVCGVTYGPFSGADHFTDAAIVARDFEVMREHGINTIRVYTVPPTWLLDKAHAVGLNVMVGLPWEQHVAFLTDDSLCDDIERNVRRQVRLVAGHPAIFCYIVGNEISSAIVRWHGPEAIERFIHRLYQAVKQEDSLALVTYANFPSTQYLRLPFLDFVSFNVYLENRQEMSKYLASLHHECDDRPLLLTEVGLDSSKDNEASQAMVLDWQVRTTFEAGCAGVVLFSWTDEWTAGGMEITDWKFGLTTRDRKPKPALAAVARAFADVPFPASTQWPAATVIVCTHNGQRTLSECLEAVGRVEYPNLEVIVVDDGSTDATAQIAARFPVKLIRCEHQGLSAARNTGMTAAGGEYVAYLDDDARPDRSWLKYAVMSLMHSNDAGVGGPNLPCPEDGLTARCVAESPGNATHIMLTERVAEHIPGCNMVFRKSALLAVGGFDPQFWIAGDDVDLCWRLQEQGMTLGFSPAAVVWHHRRGTVRGYLRQQVNYGKAEAELERKWPHKYNMPGHLAWVGRLYARDVAISSSAGQRKIFYGAWGSALFQTAHAVPASLLATFPTMPDWYLVTIALAGISVLGVFWSPLLIAVPLLAAAMLLKFASIATCFINHWRQSIGPDRESRLKAASLTTMLHSLQPLARFWGRTCGGLTPWRWCDVRSIAPASSTSKPFPITLPLPRTLGFWSETWQPRTQRLETLKSAVRETGVAVRSGGSFDRWDLEVRGGVVGAARLLSSVEEHGQGRQLTLIRIWPKFRAITFLAMVTLLSLAILAWSEHHKLSATLLVLAAALLIYRCLRDTTVAIGTLVAVLGNDAAMGKLTDLTNRLQRSQRG